MSRFKNIKAFEDFNINSSTNDGYWNCNCSSHYIHPMVEKECAKCGAKAENSPASKKEEITAMFNTFNESEETAHSNGCECKSCMEKAHSKKCRCKAGQCKCK